MQLSRGYAVTYNIYLYIALNSIYKSLNPTLHAQFTVVIHVGSVIKRLLVRAHCAPLFSSNNVCLLAYVITGEDPQSEWLKRGEYQIEYAGLRLF